MSRKAADIFVSLYKKSEKRFIVAVSGGNTPEKLYKLLGSKQYRGLIDWSRVHLFWTDERFVGKNNMDSNYRLLHDTLLKNINIPPENIHSVNTGVSSWMIAAKNYEKEIKKFFNLSRDSLPEFKLILLGIGEDGHTASLFPENKVLREKVKLVSAVRSKIHMHPRITLTLPVINNAENIIFLVSGKNKANILRRVIEEKDPALPAVMVKPRTEKLLFIIDEESGSCLTKGVKKCRIPTHTAP